VQLLLLPAWLLLVAAVAFRQLNDNNIDRSIILRSFFSCARNNEKQYLTIIIFF
jgi:hypothetical protein